jgi:predicted nucleic acid-binding protein
VTIVLDSGAVGYLAERSPYAAAVLRRLRRHNAWPPIVPTVVMVECLTGHAARDAPVHRVLNECDIREFVPIRLARRAAYLRTRARRGSAVDAIVVATAEPGGIAVTGDRHDFEALAGSSPDVQVEVV